MALNQPISFAGFEADVSALINTHDALQLQASVLRQVMDQNYVNSFLPENLVDPVRKSAYSKGIDPTIVETLILVGLVGSFQKFIKVLVSDALNTIRHSNGSFSSIDESRRSKYLSAAANAYRFKPDGTVHGVRVNFAAIELSLTKCLSDDPSYTLEGEAVTAEMGNPTPKVIDGIFDRIGVSSPFSPTYGQCLIDAGWEATSSGDAIRNSQSLLIRNINRRNDAVHGMQKIVFTEGEVSQLCDDFLKIGMGLFASVAECF
jgi:RiboL-PSP-HEPN